MAEVCAAFADVSKLERTVGISRQVPRTRTQRAHASRAQCSGCDPSTRGGAFSRRPNPMPQVQEVTEIMNGSINEMLATQDDLQVLEDKTDALANQAQNFQRSARRWDEARHLPACLPACLPATCPPACPRHAARTACRRSLKRNQWWANCKLKLAMCTIILVVIAMVTVPLIVQAMSLANGGDDGDTVYVTVGAPPVSPGLRPIFSPPSPPPVQSPPPG